MRLDQVRVELRPRSPWEAMELGNALVRHHAGAIWRPWAAATLPVFVLLNAAAWALDALWLATLAMWWLLPLFDRIVQSPQNLIAIHTANADDVLAQFRLLALRTGQSVYSWQDEAGIASLREREMRVPGSKRATDALRYILQSPQFGVYLFTDFAEHMRPPNTGLLRQIARSRSVTGR